MLPVVGHPCGIPVSKFRSRADCGAFFAERIDLEWSAYLSERALALPRLGG